MLRLFEEVGRRRRLSRRELVDRLADAERRIDDLDKLAGRLRQLELAAQFAGTALLTPSGGLDEGPAS